MHMFSEVKNLKVNEGYIMANFDMVSLFTWILMKESIEAINEVIDEKTVNLIEVCITFMFFSFKEMLYEYIEGIVMGSPLSLAVANIYMESFEKLSLNPSPPNLNGGKGLLMTLILIGCME